MNSSHLPNVVGPLYLNTETNLKFIHFSFVSTFDKMFLHTPIEKCH